MPSTRCQYCGYSCDRPMDFCFNCGMNLNPNYTLDSRLYEHPADRKALETVKKLKPVNMAIDFILDKLGTPWMEGPLIGGAVRVSAWQFPEIYELVLKAAKILAVPKLPNTYVKYSPVMNAYTFGTDDRPIIVLHSAIVDEMDKDELLYVIGHEMGHVKSGHVIYHTVIRVMTSVAASIMPAPLRFIWDVSTGLALLSWSRKSEYTADRAGLIVCGDLDAAMRAQVKLALGSKKLFEKVNYELFLKQLETLDEEVVSRFSELTLSHPFGAKRILNMREFYHSPIYKQIRSGAEAFLRGETPPPLRLPTPTCQPSQSAYRCPFCGSYISPASVFCPKCGRKLR